MQQASYLLTCRSGCSGRRACREQPHQPWQYPWHCTVRLCSLALALCNAAHHGVCLNSTMFMHDTTEPSFAAAECSMPNYKCITHTHTQCVLFGHHNCNTLCCPAVPHILPGFVPYAGEGFALLLPSKWNPSKEKDFPGVVLRWGNVGLGASGEALGVEWGQKGCKQ